MYISNPHFYLADPALLEAVEGLKPNQTLHESYFKIQPVSTLPLKLGCIYKHYRLQSTWFDQFLFFIQQKLGVPLEGKVRVQLNLKVDQSIYINSLKNFRSFVFPVIWVEEVCIWKFLAKIIIIQLHPKRTSSSQTIQAKIIRVEEFVFLDPKYSRHWDVNNNFNLLII